MNETSLDPEKCDKLGQTNHHSCSLALTPQNQIAHPQMNTAQLYYPTTYQQNKISTSRNIRPKSQRKAKGIKKTTYIDFDISSITNAEELQAKTTINKIRSQRQQLLVSKQQLENRYKYYSNRLKKDKIKNAIESQKQKNRSRVISESRISKENHQRVNIQQSQHIQHQNYVALKAKRKLKQSVLEQKIQKQKSLHQLFKEHALAGQQIRNEKKFCHHKIEEQHAKTLELNKKIYLRGKIAQKQHSRQIFERFQSKVKQARQNFKQKWLKQYKARMKTQQKVLKSKNRLEKQIAEILKLANEENSKKAAFNSHKSKKVNSTLIFF